MNGLAATAARIAVVGDGMGADQGGGLTEGVWAKFEARLGISGPPVAPSCCSSVLASIAIEVCFFKDLYFGTHWRYSPIVQPHFSIYPRHVFSLKREHSFPSLGKITFNNTFLRAPGLGLVILSSSSFAADSTSSCASREVVLGCTPCVFSDSFPLARYSRVHFRI